MTSPAPIVGIAATVRRLDLPFATLDAHTVLSTFVDAVERAGGTPVLLPVSGPASAARAVAAVDALVLAGGVDLDPATYGGPHDPEGDPTGAPHDPDRDRHELALVGSAFEAGIPVLGVCRGMHVLNVSRGGTLVAHVEGHRDFELRHDVAVEPGSILAGVVGTGLATGSLHHQAVADLGDGLRVAATAADGVVEAIEATSGRPVLGVQWHPELEAAGAGEPLWRWLVDEAAVRR